MRVVIADDSPVTIDWLRAELRKHGHDVVAWCKSGADALIACAQKKPDLVILDIIMPPINGDEAARIVRRENLASKILIATSQGQQQARDLALELDAKILIKPYGEAKLEAALKSFGE